MIDWSRRFAWTSLAAMTALMVGRQHDRDSAGMQESRPARHALLRREQRSGRRCADRSEKTARSFHARIRLHPSGGPGGLSERVQAAHRFPGSVHRQAGSLLPGAIKLGRDRGDALGSPPCRGLLDRTDGIRRQYGGSGSVRRQGHRKGTAWLPSPVHRQEGQPLPEARRFEGQARRAHIAVVEFRPPRAARALSLGGPQAQRGLQAADVGRARQVGARRRVRRLRHGRRRFRRVRADDHAWNAEGG